MQGQVLHYWQKSVVYVELLQIYLFLDKHEYYNDHYPPLIKSFLKDPRFFTCSLPLKIKEKTIKQFKITITYIQSIFPTLKLFFLINERNQKPNLPTLL
jgi:hypothetical protein